MKKWYAAISNKKGVLYSGNDKKGVNVVDNLKSDGKIDDNEIITTYDFIRDNGDLVISEQQWVGSKVAFKKSDIVGIANEEVIQALKGLL